MKERLLIPGEIYQHFKGNLYQIITIGKHSETGEELVVYQAMYGDFQVYIRPVSMFLEKLDLTKYPNKKQEYRFELVKSPYGVNAMNVFEKESINQETEFLYDKETKEDNVRIIEASKDNEQVEQLYISFFDAETCKEKLDIMQAMKNDIDIRMLNNIAASMDLPIEEDNLEDVYEIIIKNLEQRSRFECNRLR